MRKLALPPTSPDPSPDFYYVILITSSYISFAFCSAIYYQLSLSSALMWTQYLRQYFYHKTSILSFLKILDFNWLYFIKYFKMIQYLSACIFRNVFLVLSYLNNNLNGYTICRSCFSHLRILQIRFPSLPASLAI